jgi:hypothetical protein
VIIGCGATVLGGALSEILKYLLDNRKHRLKSKQESYELIHRTLVKILLGLQKNDMSTTEITELIEETSVKVGIYASNKVFESFGKLTVFFLNQSTGSESLDLNLINIEFLKMLSQMRKELGYML